MSEIAEKLSAVRAEIGEAAHAAGRDPASVRLVAVSKTKQVEAIREAYAAGQRDFGENYVQELAAKAEALADLPGLRFHFIGHLQRNKAKLAVRFSSAVHTVDSVRLAAELGKRADEGRLDAARMFVPPGGATDGRLTVLAEVNVGGEAQKSGARVSELGLVLDAIDAEPALRLVGLMTVPPATEDPGASRAYFDSLAGLRDEHGGVARLPELSMGMTHDFRQAVAAGATVVRIGTAIFGERR